MIRPSFLFASLVLAACAPLSGQRPAQQPATWVTLGTQGGPIASASRSQPANLLLAGNTVILVDCGDGAVEQLAKVGIPLPRVQALVLSHLHFDHTGGVAALLGLRYQTNVPGKLKIYGPPGTKALIDGLIASMQPAAEAGYGLAGEPSKRPADTVEVTEVRGGAHLMVGDATVTTVQNTHYSFPPGSVQDQKFKSLSFRFEMPGRTIFYTGDTGPSVDVEALARGADLLVSEMIDVPATLENVHRNTPDMPAQALAGLTQHLTTQHLTPTQVGELAARAGVKQVAVTHLSPGTTDRARIAQYLAEIHKNFAGPAEVAHDLERF